MCPLYSWWCLLSGVRVWVDCLYGWSFFPGVSFWLVVFLSCWLLPLLLAGVHLDLSHLLVLEVLFELQLGHSTSCVRCLGLLFLNFGAFLEVFWFSTGVLGAVQLTFLLVAGSLLDGVLDLGDGVIFLDGGLVDCHFLWLLSGVVSRLCGVLLLCFGGRFNLGLLGLYLGTCSSFFWVGFALCILVEFGPVVFLLEFVG